MMIISSTSSWEELDNYVSNLQGTSPRWKIWKDIERKQISVSSIDCLLSRDLVLREDNAFSNITGAVIQYKGCVEIWLRRGLSPYKRDVTLFHELAHIIHHPNLSNNRYAGNISPKEANDREAITEWLGRKARADPELLRHAVLSFGLDAYIYDKSSYQAFQGIKCQRCFSFRGKEYLKTLMD